MFRALLKSHLKKVGPVAKVNFSVTFSDGSTYSNHSDGTDDLSITFKNQRGERKLVLGNDVGFAEAYLDGDIDVIGSIGRLSDIVEASLTQKDFSKFNLRKTIFDFFHELRFSNSNIKQAKENAKFHYNLGSEALFHQYLDAQSPYNIAPTYTCAYWREGTENLDQAQFNKLDHVCRKVQLKSGDKLVDVGSGWGSLLFHAYERYGISEGVNISPTPDQNRWMQEQVNRLNLQDTIKIREADFREIEGLEGQFDSYISTGVFEHAGRGQLEAWIKAMADLLKPGGKGLLHFIGLQRKGHTSPFILKHVFPGGYLPELGETLQIMQDHGLEMLDVENLRRHYHLTLAEWAKNFDKNWDKIQAADPEKFDERFRRRWHLYLWACSEGFNRHNVSIGLYQITFSKGPTNDYPMSRTFLYENVSQPTETKLR